LQQPAQQAAVGSHHKRAGYKRKVEAFRRRKRGKFKLDLAHQLVDPEACKFGTQGACVEAGHIEQRPENFFDRFERGIDIVNQAAVFAAAAFGKARDVKPRGIERLQDVVACRRQKLVRNIGCAGSPFARQRDV
jgi:hypothetical protein